MKKKQKILNEEIIEEKIKDWIESYDLPIDSSNYLKLAYEVSKNTCNTLLNSISKKIGLLEGIKRANDILKYKFETTIEIDIKELEKEIENIAKLELSCLAINSSSFSKETKEKLFNKYLENYNSKDNLLQKKDSVREGIRDHLNRIYQQIGEQPDPNINNVNKVKNIVVKPEKKK